VVKSNSCKGPSPSWKGAKKEPKEQLKILGPASVIWDQISEILSPKGPTWQPWHDAPKQNMVLSSQL